MLLAASSSLVVSVLLAASCCELVVSTSDVTAAFLALNVLPCSKWYHALADIGTTTSSESPLGVRIAAKLSCSSNCSVMPVSCSGINPKLLRNNLPNLALDAPGIAPAEV